MALICWLSAEWLSQQLLIVGSFGATSVLIYAAPESPFAQPSHVLFGSVLSACVGVGCYQWLGATPLSMALAVSLSRVKSVKLLSSEILVIRVSAASLGFLLEKNRFYGKHVL